MSNNFDKTAKFASPEKSLEAKTKQVLNDVYEALRSKGYNPINQMVGYLLSGDPTYITSHGNARSEIRSIERDEIIEVILKEYLEK